MGSRSGRNDSRQQSAAGDRVAGDDEEKQEAGRVVGRTLRGHDILELGLVRLEVSCRHAPGDVAFGDDASEQAIPVNNSIVNSWKRHGRGGSGDLESLMEGLRKVGWDE